MTPMALAFVTVTTLCLLLLGLGDCVTGHRRLAKTTPRVPLYAELRFLGHGRRNAFNPRRGSVGSRRGGFIGSGRGGFIGSGRRAGGLLDKGRSGSRFEPLGSGLSRHGGGTRAQDLSEKGAVRLVGGADPRQGRVEMYINGAWGSVCDDFWDEKDAAVVCRQLGHNTSAVKAHSNAYFGRGAEGSRIWLRDVECAGHEARLRDCPSQHNGHLGCSHGEDAGVDCDTTRGFSGHGDVRLVGGTSPKEGRVEVQIHGEWGSVCDDDWGEQEATVVCRQLGYTPRAARAHVGAHYGQWVDGHILLDGLRCTGREARLLDCPAQPLGQHDCTHREDAGVDCDVTSGEANEGDIRLVGGNHPTEGMLEIFLNGSWGTVCDDSWDDVDAAVVCRQLGYTSPKVRAYSGGYYGRGHRSSKILLDSVRCSGREARLLDCPAGRSGQHGCRHSQDAGLDCDTDL